MISSKASTRVSSLPRFLFCRLQQVRKRGICSDQNLTLIRMMTCVLATEIFFKKSATPKSNQEPPQHPLFPKSASTTSGFSKSATIPKTPSIPEPPFPLQGFYLPEIFPILKVSHPKSKAQNINSLSSPPAVSSSIFPTFITYNAIFSADSYGQWHILRHAILSASANNHSRYNKSNM